MDGLIETVGRNILDRNLIPGGQAVLAAVSGGADSMVLLRVLHRLAAEHGWGLAAAHFNHRLRGRSSDADERLACRAAAALGCPFFAGRGDVRALARREKISIEMAARTLRHEFLAGTARENGIGVVALAHHADDQVELFLLRLLRGAGGDGLGGMKWSSPSPADPAVRLVRPLLDQPKSALLQFARERRVLFREDASNRSAEFLRNRIRHDILPRLKAIQPALPASVLRTMEIVGAEAELAAAAAARWLAATKRGRFDRLPVAVQRRILLAQLQTAGLDADFDLVERLRLRPGEAVSVSCGRDVCLGAGGLLRFRDKEPSAAFSGGEHVLTLEKDGAAGWSGAEFSWRIRPHSGPVPRPAAPGMECFDADRIGRRIILRHWKPGDRFQPIGMKEPVKLQDLFVNLKVPRAERHRRIVAAAADGSLFWVEGLRISEAFKLDKATCRRLEWGWRRL